MNNLKKNWPRYLTHFLSLLPLASLAWNYSQNQLTANPIREITLRTGMYSLILLVLSLACTPVANITGFKTVLSLRRLLGLYGFFYACLHLLNFIGTDYRFNFTFISADVFGKAYFWIGVAALILLVPAAVTSTRGWMRRLGKNWERLHWLVYPAVLLSVLHFLLLVKANRREPVVYGIIVVFLLILRLKWVKNAINRLRISVLPFFGRFTPSE